MVGRQVCGTASIIICRQDVMYISVDIHRSGWSHPSSYQQGSHRVARGTPQCSGGGGAIGTRSSCR